MAHEHNLQETLANNVEWTLYNIFKSLLLILMSIGLHFTLLEKVQVANVGTWLSTSVMFGLTLYALFTLPLVFLWFFKSLMVSLLLVTPHRLRPIFPILCLLFQTPLYICLKKVLAMQLLISWNLLCWTYWTQTHSNPSTTTFWVLALHGPCEVASCLASTHCSILTLNDASSGNSFLSKVLPTDYRKRYPEGKTHPTPASEREEERV